MVQKVTEALGVRQVAFEFGEFGEASSVHLLGQLIHHCGRVADMAGALDIAQQVESRCFRRGNAHDARLRVDLLGRSLLDMELSEEPDTRATGHDRTELPIGHNLELLRLLVGRAVEGCSAEQSNVVPPLAELHQLIYEPARRRCSGLAVLHGDDDKEAPAGDGEAALGDEALDRLP